MVKPFKDNKSAKEERARAQGKFECDFRNAQSNSGNTETNLKEEFQLLFGSVVFGLEFFARGCLNVWLRGYLGQKPKTNE